MQTISINDFAKQHNLNEEEKLFFLKQQIKNLSLYDFCHSLLGYVDMNAVHKDLCSFLEQRHTFKLILMPRNSFKSTISTVGYAIWRLLKNPDLRIMIYSDASSKATGFLTSIKAHIEGNSAGSLFGKIFDWTPVNKSKKWNESEIVIRDRKAGYPESSIETGGIETSKVGKHYDLIIFDDIVSDLNITTKEQMDKVSECYKKSLSLLKPGGDVVMVGTRWHFGDLYGRLLAENSKKEVFKVFFVDGEEDKKYGKYPFENCGSNSLTPDFLSRQKAMQGSYTYSCLYRNNPVDSDTAIFKASNFSFYGEIKPDDLYITATCDPAGQGKDKTAITVVGTDHEMCMHVLDVVDKSNLTPTDIVNEIIRLHAKYRFKIFGIETIFLQKTIKHELQRVLDEYHKENPVMFPLFGIEEFDGSSRVGKSKFSRIMGLQPYHERGKIKFPGDKIELLKEGFSSLAHQMLEFTPDHMPEPNDALDSLADHINLIRKGGVVKKVELPRNTPAWLERKSLEDEIQRNATLPRRFRRTLGQLAFS